MDASCWVFWLSYFGYSCNEYLCARIYILNVCSTCKMHAYMDVIYFSSPIRKFHIQFLFSVYLYETFCNIFFSFLYKRIISEYRLLLSVLMEQDMVVVNSKFYFLTKILLNIQNSTSLDRFL